jgi:hypothetical protein
MTARTLTLTRSKFKIPKFKFALSNEEMLVIFMCYFTYYIDRIYYNTFIYWPLLLGELYVYVWAIMILQNYTKKEKMSTGKNDKHEFFSDSFCTDLLLIVFALGAGYVVTNMVNGDSSLRLFTTILSCCFPRILLRYFYRIS